MIDISKNTAALEAINGILDNEHIAEVKVEYDKQTKKNAVVVVELRRRVRSSEAIKE